MDSMFEILMGVPLFHGVTYQKMSEIIGKHRFHFLKYDDGQQIIGAGEQCTHMKTIVSGKVRVSVSNSDNRVRVSQTLEAPDIIAPDFFFGKTTRYPASVCALGPCGIMQIDKNDYLDIINSDSVFLFNFLNLLSVNAQLSLEGVLALTSGDLRKRIAYWIVALTQRNGRDIVMECRQKDLYGVFGVPRQSLLAALSEMKAEGLLDYSTSRISVTERRRLADLLTE